MPNHPIPNHPISTYRLTLLAGAVLLAAVLVLQYTPDDAFISFRYALNLAQGHGPVFNLGEHVEGYTSPGWVFLLALFQRAGIGIETTALFLSAFSALGAVLCLPALSRRLGLALNGWDALLLATNASFAIWAGASMEMVVFAFALVLAALALVSEKRHWLAGLALAGLAFLRPEGMLFGGVAALWLLPPVLRREKGAWRAWVLFCACFALPLLVHLAWRLSYYGYPLPNTFYDKVGLSAAQVLRGLGYLSEAALTYLLPLTLPVLVGISRLGDNRWLRYLAVTLALYLAYTVSVGGDWMVSFRLFTPVMPLIALFAGVGLTRLLAGIAARIPLLRAPGWRIAAIVLLLALNLAPALVTDRHQDYVDGARPIADWLNAHCPPDSRLAVFAAGALPWYTPTMPIVDMFGLMDAEIAHRTVATIGEGTWAGHEKFNAEITRQRDPAIYILQGAPGDHPITEADGWNAEPLAHLIRQFTDDETFWADHSTQNAPLGNQRYFNFIVKNPYPCK